ncbi:MAG: Hpt domain-containing protein [Geminicoccaceae bacterium]
MTLSETAWQDLPLVDLILLAELAADIERRTLAGYLRRAISDAERAANLIEAVSGTPQEVRQAAHKLRGSSATLALARLAGLADAIEQCASRGADTAERIAALRPLIAATSSRIEELARGI